MQDFTEPIIDIGANLTHRQFQKDLPQVLRRANDAGLGAIICTGTSMRESRACLALASRMQSKTRVPLFATVGVHPHDAKTFDEEATLAEMRQLIVEHPAQVVAVGECGLDFNRDFSPRDKQERVLRAQIELACELQLPVFLHERDAFETMVAVLQPFVDAKPKRLPPVVVHCFTGRERELRKYLSMGFYIGLTGFICMESRGRTVRAMVPQIPMDRLMIETDAPFMYPYGNNLRARCEPKDLRAVVHTIATCYGRPPSEVARMTTENARRFFSLAAKTELQHAAAQPASSAAAAPRKAKATPPPAPVEAKRLSEETKPSAIAEPASNAILVDGGEGEGGGQVIRMTIALASVLHKSVHIHNVRANRKVPGLRNQHTQTVQLAQRVSSARVEGARLGSTEVTFDAEHAYLHGGEFEAVSTTGGSISLMIQGSLPALLFAARSTKLSLTGGTHVGFSPPIDFMQHPLQEMLARMGAHIDLDITRCGFFPAGRGHVTLQAQCLTKPLQPIDVTAFTSDITRVRAFVTVCGPTASDDLGAQYANAVKRKLQGEIPAFKASVFESVIRVEVAAPAKARFARKAQAEKGKKQERADVSVLVVVETATGCMLTADHTGKDTADFTAREVVGGLSRHLQHQVCVDEHVADNLIVFMALAQGTSRLCVPSKKHRSSEHLETALDVIARLSGAICEIQESDSNALVTVHGIGLAPNEEAIAQ